MRIVAPVFAVILVALSGCSNEQTSSYQNSGILEPDDLGISKHSIHISRDPSKTTVIEVRIFENDTEIEAKEHVSTNWDEKDYNFISMDRSTFTGEMYPDYVVRFPYEIIEIGEYYQIQASYSSSLVAFEYRSFREEPNRTKRIEFKIFAEDFEDTKKRIPDASPKGWYYSGPIKK